MPTTMNAVHESLRLGGLALAILTSARSTFFLDLLLAGLLKLSTKSLPAAWEEVFGNHVGSVFFGLGAFELLLGLSAFVTRNSRLVNQLGACVFLGMVAWRAFLDGDCGCAGGFHVEEWWLDLVFVSGSATLFPAQPRVDGVTFLPCMALSISLAVAGGRPS